MKRVYLNLPDAIEMHRLLIDEFGGSHGIREPGALESAMMRPQSGYYEDLIQEAAALMESLSMNHPFVDGNKRTAFAVTDAFLGMNGHFIVCDSLEAYKTFMDMFESGTFTFAYLDKWLRKHVKPLSPA
jgi:death-on-curing protein